MNIALEKSHRDELQIHWSSLQFAEVLGVMILHDGPECRHACDRCRLRSVIPEYPCQNGIVSQVGSQIHQHRCALPALCKRTSVSIECSLCGAGLRSLENAAHKLLHCLEAARALESGSRLRARQDAASGFSRTSRPHKGWFGVRDHQAN